jgi:hypothetical protein
VNVPIVLLQHVITRARPPIVASLVIAGVNKQATSEQRHAPANESVELFAACTSRVR